MNYRAFKLEGSFIMKQLIAIICLVSISWTASAYEQDTHLRMTYLIARATGINDQTAKFLAYGNQNIDQTAITSAMLMPPQRALFHFTGSFQNLKNSAHGGDGGILGRLKQLFWSKKISIAERNHAVGSMLIYQGLVDGDLQKVSAGLHVKMDTYGHAGFTNAWGHMFDGHNPDRVFIETEKYQDMNRALVQSMVAIRDALPEEAKDMEGALKFLNQFSHESGLNRELTITDLADATKISSVINSSTELKKLYAENTFNNFSFKKLALKMIFDDFKARGVFHSDVKFSDVFTNEILSLRQLDTADTIVAVMMEDMRSEFLKTSDGKDIFDEEKLYKHYAGGKAAEFKLKLDLEEKRFAQRLRDFEHRRLRLKSAKNFSSNHVMDLEKAEVEKEYFELSRGLNLANVDEEIMNVMKSSSQETQNEIERLEKEIVRKYEEMAAPYFEKIDKNAAFTGDSKIAFEKLAEISSGMQDEITEMKRSRLVDTFVQIRARQLAQHKFATELANKLTKDFVPRKYNQYFKQLFESETYTRVFETFYKDEAWRRFIFKSFGINWVNGTKKDLLTEFTTMRLKFKKMISRRSSVLQARTNRILLAEAKKAAAVLIEGDIPSRDEAQEIQFNRLGKITYVLKMFKYLGYGTAFIPYIGEKYLQRIYRTAEKKAKAHEVENIPEKIAEGKYKIFDLSGNTGVQLQQMSAPNKCVHLFL